MFRRRRFLDLPTLVLVGVSYAFRFPALLNARGTNSDAAVVGLQAMHLLRGERSAFLWGSGYQTSADSFVAAAFFAVLGASPLTLMLSALTLHVLATYLVFAMLRRHLPAWTALLATLPLVLSPSSVHSYALYPPRQASLTLALAAFWAIDGAGDASVSVLGSDQPRAERRVLAWLTAGGALSTLAVSADPYPLLLLPLTGLFALLVAATGTHALPKGDARTEASGAWRARARRAATRLAAFALGGAAGIVPFALLMRAVGSRHGPMGLTTSRLSHHLDLLLRECLPWALSTKVYYAQHVMDYAPWDAPAAARVVQIGGAVVLAGVVGLAFAAAALPALPGLPGLAFARRVPWPVRRLGLVGALVFPLATSAFLVSVMAMDHFSMRYLVVLTLLTPLAAAPAAHLLGARRFGALFAVHLAASALGGWVGYGPFVRGIVPVTQPELADDEALRNQMRARGLRYAMADYWASYRLTLRFGEEIIVVPRNPAEDRYAPHRRAFEAAPSFAYVWDRGRSREDLATVERELAATARHVEKASVGSFTVFFVDRDASASPLTAAPRQTPP